MPVSWNEGYVVDVPYTEQVFREMTPPWLSLSSVLNLQPPLDTTRPFTYLELGCGKGLTANTIAATIPAATVWACDFNPAHVERARKLASTSALTNCSFAEASFEELAHDPSFGPPTADVIALHGIYSWVSAANRQHILEIIRRRLVPGGLVYVSYDVPTGWAALLPVQQALRLQVRTDRRRSDVAIRAAIATIEQLAEEGAAAFPLPPREQSMLDSMDQRDPVYVAHEFLGGSFTPLMFADVAAELAAAKCVYAGSTTITAALPDLRVPAGLTEVVQSVADVPLRETICDLGSQAMFRADVFRRGLGLVTALDHGHHLDELHFVNAGLAFDQARKVVTGAGEAQLDTAHYAPLVERLLEGPASVAELRTLPTMRGRPDHDVRASVTMLASAGYALPTMPDWPRNGSVESSWRMNRSLIDSLRRGDYRGVLVSPATGNVISVTPLVAFAIGELWDGVASEEDALQQAVDARVNAELLPTLPAGDDRRDLIAAEVQQALQLLAGPFRTLGIRAPDALRRGSSGAKRRRG